MIWVLILTMVARDYRAGGAVASVPGFRDEAACMAAASAWLKLNAPSYSRNTALCVKAQ